MPRSTKICLVIILLMVVLFGSTLIYLFSQESVTPTIPPVTDHTGVSEDTCITEPVVPLIDYQVQGYLAYKGSIISQAELVMRNPEIPPLASENGTNASDFEYMQITGFPLISNEPNCATVRILNDNIQELKMSKTGSTRDPQTGQLKQYLEVEYTVLIDLVNSEVLLCIIRIYQENSSQQYYFSTVNSIRTINDILSRAYNE